MRYVDKSFNFGSCPILILYMAYFPNVRLREQTRDGKGEDGDERQVGRTQDSHLSGDCILTGHWPRYSGH